MDVLLPVGTTNQVLSVESSCIGWQGREILEEGLGEGAVRKER